MTRAMRPGRAAFAALESAGAAVAAAARRGAAALRAAWRRSARTPEERYLRDAHDLVDLERRLKALERESACPLGGSADASLWR